MSTGDYFVPPAAFKSETYYDKLEDAYDDLHFKKKKTGKHLMGVDVEMIVPKEGEVRLLGNRNR